MTQYGFFYDQSRCYNCHNCSVACRDWNGIEPGNVKWLRMLQWETGAFPNTRIHALSAHCYHCQNPVCMEACRYGAILKEDKYGAVLVDQDACVGCHDCYEACPYGAPQFESNEIGSKMSMCDMCYDRLENGEQPTCVMACPGRALDFGPLDELEEKYGSLHALEDMPSGAVEQPSVVFKPMQPRRDIIAYDSERALELFAHRATSELPDVYEDARDVTDIPEGLVGYDRLVMKAATVEEALAASKNEEG